MSQYMQDLASLRARRCETCHGLGECNDAAPGDISFRTWQCESCKGTGKRPSSFEEGVKQEAVDSALVRC